MVLKTRVKRGGSFDDWDLQVRNGLFSKSRGLLTIEEHGAGKQYLRFKCWAYYSTSGFIIIALLASLCILAAIENQFLVSFILGLMVVTITFRFLLETASSMSSLYTAFKLLGVEEPVEQVKLLNKEKINGELNEAIHADKEYLNPESTDNRAEMLPLVVKTAKG